MTVFFAKLPAAAIALLMSSALLYAAVGPDDARVAATQTAALKAPARG